jgi:hypothetical protein
MLVTPDHYADQANLTRGSLTLRPGKQHSRHYLRVSAPYVFGILLHVAPFTATARAESSEFIENGTECAPRGAKASYQEHVEVYKGAEKQIVTLTHTCTCIVSGTSTDPGSQDYEWRCD